MLERSRYRKPQWCSASIGVCSTPGNIYSNEFSGVVRQALTWAERLRECGFIVDFGLYEKHDWSEYDLIHLFQYGNWADGLINRLLQTIFQ